MHGDHAPPWSLLRASSGEFNVLGRLELGRKHVADDALCIDQIGRPTRDEPKRPRYPIARPHRAIPVAQEPKRELEPPRKAIVGSDRIRADADDLGPCLEKRLVAVAERTRLRRANGRVIPGVEEEHHRPAQEIRQFDRLPVGRRHAEIWRHVAYSYTADFSHDGSPDVDFMTLASHLVSLMVK